MTDQHSQDKPLGLRERKRIETRLTIEDTATRLFLERSYDSVTLDEICARSNISRRTFFNYFASKDDVAAGIIPTAVSPETEAFIADLQSDEDGTFAHKVFAFIVKRRVNQIREIVENPIDPELATEIAKRRITIVKRNPLLAVSRSRAYEAIREDIQRLVRENFTKYPGNRIMPELAVGDEVFLFVNSLVHSLWTAQWLALHRDHFELSEKSVQAAVDGMATILQSFGTITMDPHNPSNN